ncbi:TfpX/TfpZ family type IV pilin accessory protein [Diaphorobacter caeni]|uniref:TfpX/TfpZ family type IV pilin accessory protein n=1 Tax=Diaphorobacter caeni TaxID=2784387 RepID=UPI00188FF9AB|nr:TfpX/TfpZ family type IV pilin accessory protein [Diaphorobacter caeni]MBF5004925.1 hypothetical protein [Diaphorobacter caeni]
MYKNQRLSASFKAAAIHLAISLIIGAVAAIIVFGFWFRFPYESLAGGQHLFWMLVSIDVICGPLLTAILYNPKKSRAELFIDLSIVSILQIAALLYGLHTISLARPVRLAFEVDRFVAVSPVDIDMSNLHRASRELRSFGWTGPVLVGTRGAQNGDEVIESINLSAQGFEPSARPAAWVSYESNREQVKSRMRSLAKLRGQVSDDVGGLIDNAVRKSGKKIEEIYYLPLVSKKNLDEWVVFLDADANIVGYAAVDGFLP